MKNECRICGDEIHVILRHRNGDTRIMRVSVSDRERLDDIPGRIGPLYDGTTGRYYARAIPIDSPKQVLFHRWLMNAPEGMQVDHINHDALDNRRENLRVVTATQNQINRSGLQRNNRSGHRGVTWSAVQQGWIAEVCWERKPRKAGPFHRIEDAVAAQQRLLTAAVESTGG